MQKNAININLAFCLFELVSNYKVIEKVIKKVLVNN